MELKEVVGLIADARGEVDIVAKLPIDKITQEKTFALGAKLMAIGQQLTALAGCKISSKTHHIDEFIKEVNSISQH